MQGVWASSLCLWTLQSSVLLSQTSICISSKGFGQHQRKCSLQETIEHNLKYSVKACPLLIIWDSACTCLFGDPALGKEPSEPNKCFTVIKELKKFGRKVVEVSLQQDSQLLKWVGSGGAGETILDRAQTPHGDSQSSVTQWVWRPLLASVGTALTLHTYIHAGKHTYTQKF